MHGGDEELPLRKELGNGGRIDIRLCLRTQPETFGDELDERRIDQSLDRGIGFVDDIAAIGRAAAGKLECRMDFAARGKDHLQAGHAADIDGPAGIFLDRLRARMPPQRIAHERSRTLRHDRQRHLRRFPLAEIRHVGSPNIHESPIGDQITPGNSTSKTTLLRRTQKGRSKLRYR